MFVVEVLVADEGGAELTGLVGRDGDVSAGLLLLRLGLLLQIPHLDLTGARFPENYCPRDVGLISKELHPVVDLDHVAFLELLRRNAAVREGGVLAETRRDAP